MPPARAGRRGLRRGAGHFRRLCADGTLGQGRRGALLHRLERHRLLAGAARAEPGGRKRQPGARRKRAARRQQLLHRLAEAPGRCRRRARPDHRRHPRRPAGGRRGAQPGRQVRRPGTQAPRPRRVPPAPHGQPALGHLHRARGRPPLQDQAHRGAAQGLAVVADAPPSQRALDRGQRHGAGGERRARIPPQYQRVHLHSRRPQPPPEQPGDHRSGDDRGAERRVPRRGRHRPLQRHLRSRPASDEKKA
ncbi:Uncharacterised protein [Pseudomonas aeruginosa]|nr:Uncharacterised protein [Pseudomonas aeruginosa]